jgi:DNA/RNA endonuclease G (NUC1)
MVMLRLGFAFLFGYAALAQDLFFGGTAPTTSAPAEIIFYHAYAVGYSEAARTPLWSVYQVAGASAPKSSVPRTHTFFTEFRTSSRVGPRDYLHTGFSRGHMTPFAAIGRAYGADPARETNSMANVAPQMQPFNAGIWSRLEAAVDGRGNRPHFHPGLTQKVVHIWIYTGPVLAPGTPAVIGPKQIQVPSAFWKAAVGLTPQGQAHACAWIIPHDETLESRSFRAFASSMREVERQTHVTLVPHDDQGVMEREDADEVAVH